MKVFKGFLALVFMAILIIGCQVPDALKDEVQTYGVPAGTYIVATSSVTAGLTRAGTGSTGTLTVNSDGSFSFSGGSISGTLNGALVFQGTLSMTAPTAAAGSLSTLTVAGSSEISPPVSGVIAVSSVDFSFSNGSSTDPVNITLTF